jgi:tetratricopeptide (TPR) repeat protein
MILLARKETRKTPIGRSMPMSLITTPVRLFLVAVTLAAGLLACAPQAGLREDPEDFREEVARLQRDIAENPDDAEALRDLGTIYVRTRRPNEGYKYLQKAHSQDRNDPKTLFYLGVASERIGKRQTAQELYQRYEEMPEDSRFRTLMRGRYEWLVRQEIRRKMKEYIAREDSIGVSPSAVAVLPFAYQGSDEQYAPLGHGLSEMIAVDLANIDELTLVERTRLQELLKELELSQSEFVDPSTAPRVGQLLGAGRLIGGGYDVLDEELRTDVALAELEQAESASLETQSDALDNLFQLEKEIVFRLVDQLGVELSAEERKEIERVPTRNLQAFLAYSRGLEAEAQGNYEAAAQAFQQANQLDPSFSEAASKQEASEGLSAAGGGTEQALQAARQPESPTSQIDLVQNRQQILSETVGTVPSAEDEETEDERQPAAESGNAVLEDPPPPPSGGGGSR